MHVVNLLTYFLISVYMNPLLNLAKSALSKGTLYDVIPNLFFSFVDSNTYSQRLLMLI